MDKLHENQFQQVKIISTALYGFYLSQQIKFNFFKIGNFKKMRNIYQRKVIILQQSGNIVPENFVNATLIITDNFCFKISGTHLMSFIPTYITMIIFGYKLTRNTFLIHILRGVISQRRIPGRRKTRIFHLDESKWTISQMDECFYLLGLSFTYCAI